MRVMIVVTHLLGTGHLSRALTLARAFAQAGHRVLLVSGGLPAPHLDTTGVEVVQLPPLRSDGTDFARLLTAEGGVATEAFHMKRRARLLDSFAEFAPDALLTELFPFGRRSLREEFTALLDAASARPGRPLICASIRDILAPPSRPKKQVFADDMLSAHYDLVLAHAVPEITPVELSWPLTDALRARLRYTGFVAPAAAAPAPDGAGAGEILVSAGGGDVGAHIFEAALGAAALDDSRHWRLLLGGEDATARAARMAATAPAHVTIEPARRDFRALLHHAAASVSMCGYNTALDVLQAGCPALFIPFDAGNEVEQGLRAKALAARPGCAVLPRRDLTPARLSQTLASLLTAPRPAPLASGLDGAAETVRIVEEALEA